MSVQHGVSKDLRDGIAHVDDGQGTEEKGEDQGHSTIGLCDSVPTEWPGIWCPAYCQVTGAAERFHYKVRGPPVASWAAAIQHYRTVVTQLFLIRNLAGFFPIPLALVFH